MGTFRGRPVSSAAGKAEDGETTLRGMGTRGMGTFRLPCAKRNKLK
ncbi:hypothetical protein [Desulfosporosinus fructosivorans]|nr:hypothetical protein [Desulfosporosinus fructosivorans]